MSITAQVVPVCQEILALPDVVGSPVLSWGVTAINIPDFFRKPWASLSAREKAIKLHHWLLHNLPWTLPTEFSHPDLGALLRARGVETVDILDWYDSRANLRLDMNQPIAAGLHNRYRLFVDIGCLRARFRYPPMHRELPAHGRSRRPLRTLHSGQRVGRSRLPYV